MKCALIKLLEKKVHTTRISHNGPCLQLASEGAQSWLEHHVKKEYNLFSGSINKGKFQAMACSTNPLKFIIRAQKQGLLIVTDTRGAMRTWNDVIAIPPWWSMFQGGLLCVLLVGWGEVMDSILDNVVGVHGLLKAARDALHWGTPS